MALETEAWSHLSLGGSKVWKQGFESKKMD